MIYVNDLINDALYLIAAATPEGALDNKKKQIALNWLNSLLDEQWTQTSVIPFIKKFEFYLTVGKRVYKIGLDNDAAIKTSPFATIEYLTIQQNSAIYPIEKFGYGSYQQYEQVEDVRGRPVYFYLQNQVDGQYLAFNVSPDIQYFCTINGKSTEKKASYQDYLDAPSFVKIYLTYQLASYLDDIFGMNQWTQKKEKTLIEAKNNIQSISMRGLRTSKSVPANNPNNYVEPQDWRWLIKR